MRTFTNEQIDEYIVYACEHILEQNEFIGKCVICGCMLSELNLPNGPEKKVVCLNDREFFVEEYNELIKLGCLIDTNNSGIIIKTYKEIWEDELTSYKIEGLSVGEVILLDWTTNDKVKSKIPKYFENNYAINVKDSINTLNKEKYIRLGSPLESIYNLSKIELTIILEKFNLKKRGNKSELIKRIKNNLNDIELENHIKLSWRLTQKGENFLNKYNSIVWAHKIPTIFGYHSVVTPFNVLPYLDSGKNKETIAITICQNIINQNLKSQGIIPEIVSSSLFQSEMYGLLTKDEEELSHLLFGMMFLLTGMFSRLNHCNQNIDFVGFPYYKIFKSKLTKFKHHILSDKINTIATTVYIKYHKFLPKNKMYDGLNDFINAINITIYGTESEWDKLKMNWMKKHNIDL